ncbi:transaldolase family protein [Glaciibacter psychrotolerans]|uniref:Transaldolase n=1 Tax=Glaciibacter psychrotolerans TaxID=670054 RepID=A0A7Z0J721_9MICO|nr:transaldolase family protein [Leifsonia psychrotolerans]NYJ21157.1 transaldolase [Leifsonia psychrotolerans]
MQRELRFYVDSANVDDVSTLLTDHLVHGVTTNPTILERSNRTVHDIPALYARWESEGAEEIFFQTWGSTTDEMLQNAEGIRALGERAVVKVPATRAGFAAASTLVAAGTRVLVTAVYSQGQALAAATLGVRYIAPYLGRLKDAGRDGIAEITAMQALVAGTGTDVLAASLRTPHDIVELAANGVPFFTAAPSVILAALQTDVSDASAAEFDAAVQRGLSDRQE